MRTAPASLRRLIAVLALLTACSGSDRSYATADDANTGSEFSGRDIAGGSSGKVNASPAPPPAQMGRVSALEESAPEADQAPPGANDFASDQTVAGEPMLIRTADASLRVSNVDSSVARLRELAARVGGFITSSTMQSGDYEVRSATLEIKVPAARFDEALGGLQPLGKVEYVNINAQDVGEEFTDVTARVANAQRLEKRLVELLATRTGKLEDVLAVERELARVREVIERYQGRLRYLGTRVAQSTLSVTVHEQGPIAGDSPGQNPIAMAFRAAWRNFVGFIAEFIALLGVLVPLGVLAWVAWVIIRRVRARRVQKPGARTKPPTGPGVA